MNSKLVRTSLFSWVIQFWSLQYTIDAKCDNISVLSNGATISCSPGKIGVDFEGDTCNFTCNRGYNLTGSAQRTCRSNGSWSGSLASCTIKECLDLSSLVKLNGTLSQSCNRTYLSVCKLQCQEGFNDTEDSVYLVCNVSNDELSAVWQKISNETWSCKATGSSNRNGSSHGSAVPVIFGVIGGIFLLLIITLFAVIIYFKYLQRKAAVLENSLQRFQNHKGENEDHIVSTGVTDAMYDTVDNKQEPVEYTYPISQAYAAEEIYEHATPSVSCNSIKEGQIYEIPCEFEDDCGPIYTEPPNEIIKIYESFEGKIICSKNIRILKELGSGEFGTVTLGLLSSEHGDKEVAIKVLNSPVDDDDKLRFFQEAAIMSQFNHQNVIKLYGIIVDSPVMIVLEYMPRGDLHNLLKTVQSLNEERVHKKLPLLLLKFCQEVAAGMVYLSGKRFVHRDLAARNILLNEKCTCKIADFGMSRDLIDHNYYITSGGKIPVKWTAPEALYYKKYSVHSDVWSYGCVLYEIWSLGHKPFEDLTNLKVLRELDRGYRLPPPPGCSRAIYKVMIKCWNPDPKSRPQFGQITKLLAGNVLDWSDDDKLTSGEDGMKLGAPLESTANLYSDLQYSYM